MSGYAAIILAAGTGSRFRAAGGFEASKLVAALEGEAVVRHVAQAALTSMAHPVLVVTGHADIAVSTVLAGLDIRFVHNPDFASGMAGTVRSGIEALPHDVEGAVILLGDMPAVMPAVIDHLIQAAEANPGVEAVIPTFEGRRGNPILLSRSLFPQIVNLTGDTGARQLLRGGSVASLELEVADAGILVDVDAPQDLATLHGSPRR